MEYRVNSLTYQKYISLRHSVGWNSFAEDQVSKSIDKSIYDIVVEDNGQTIAMGRLIGDGIYYLIADVVVRPGFQGKGIGNFIFVCSSYLCRKATLSAEFRKIPTEPVFPEKP